MLTTLAAVALLSLPPSEIPDPVIPSATTDERFDGYTADHHFELSMGFLGGVRDETRAGYAFNSGSAENLAYAQALTTPFALAPYDRTIVYGLGWELRYVTRHIRFTTGLQKPFASFRMMDAVFPADVGGTTRSVGTCSLELWDVRFGLGAEYAFKYAAPFVDVVGDIQSIKAAMTVDGQTAQYRAWTFGFAVRAGVRVHMGSALYIAPTGEVGLGGPVQWGVGLQAGWVIPVGE